MKSLRCAIYTRKSHDEGLEQDFNSLDAQREACKDYIRSQKAEGWVLVEQFYDDGGLSGATLKRPALTQLLADITAGLIDQIVVYKIDRLTRSLADFAKLVEQLEQSSASFVSVTQSFNTATSMGRLTLNMLLSFAQFEREVTAERIRDKIAASKKHGLWMGGFVPMGFDADNRTLKINEPEAKTIRTLYALYEQHGCARKVAEQAQSLNLTSRRRQLKSGKVTGGIVLSRGHIHRLLTNPIYAGRIRHKEQVFEGQHPAIIAPKRFDAVQQRLAGEAAKPRGKAQPNASSPLMGKVFDETGERLTPSHANKKGRRYRYYVSSRLIRQSGEPDLNGWRLAANTLEDAVFNLVQQRLKEPAFEAHVVSLSADPKATKDALRRLTSKGQTLKQTSPLVERAELKPERLLVKLSRTHLAEALAMTSDQFTDSLLKISSTFQTRRRGVETRMIFAGQTGASDPVLLRNLVLAHKWYGELRRGTSISEIARREGKSNRRIQAILELAFLAPDIARKVAEGKQPPGLTTDWLIRQNIPLAWNAQRELIAQL